MPLLLLVDRRKAARVLLRDLREEFALKDLEDIGWNMPLILFLYLKYALKYAFLYAYKYRPFL
jgi:hypothetical protein